LSRKHANAASLGTPPERGCVAETSRSSFASRASWDACGTKSLLKVLLGRVQSGKTRAYLGVIDRNVARYREEGRFSNAPDTKQQKDLAQAKADDIPVLRLLRQNGDEAKGWRGLPFWGPVILTSKSAPPVIYATKEAFPPATPNVQDARPLATEEGT